MQPYATQNLTTVSGFTTRNSDVDVSAFSTATISGMISTATRAMLNYCQVDAFLTTTVSGEMSKGVVSAEGSLIIYPRVRPIVSISGINMVDGGITVPLTLSGSGQNYYQIPYPYSYVSLGSAYLSATGMLVGGGGTSQLMSFQGSGFFASIAYVGGYTTAPEDLVDACDLWVRDIATRRLNPLGAQQVKQGSFSFNRAMRSGTGADLVDSVFVQQAKQLLDHGGYHRVALGV